MLAIALFVRHARAIDPFEIQVYDGTANRPGALGLELHLNRVFSGVRAAIAPELPPDHQSHLTIEPSLGLSSYWEIGGYFQTALRADGTFDYAGVKFRNKFVTPEGWHPNLRLGGNVELSLLPERYDRNRWGAELRPIVAWENPLWLFAINPIFGIPLAGPDSGGGPTFEPAAMAKLKIARAVGVGVEYYGSLGPISKPDATNDQLHYIYEVVDLLCVPHFELNLGVGEGLTPASNGFVAKAIAGYSWESNAPRQRAPLGFAPRVRADLF